MEKPIDDCCCQSSKGRYSCKNILITPHVSSLTQETLAELRVKTVNNVISLLRDNHPVHVVKA